MCPWSLTGKVRLREEIKSRMSVELLAVTIRSSMYINIKIKANEKLKINSEKSNNEA